MNTCETFDVITEWLLESPKMPSFRCFSGCCGIYEMYSLGVRPDDPTWGAKAVLEAVKRQLKKDSGYSEMVLIVFTDADTQGNGEAWAKYLRSQGYRVDASKLGKSTTSGNALSCYLWYATTNRPREVSLVKEFSLDGKEQEKPKTDISQSGATKGEGVKVGRRSGLSGAIRAVRRRVARDSRA